VLSVKQCIVCFNIVGIQRHVLERGCQNFCIIIRTSDGSESCPSSNDILVEIYLSF
jgi:hypothetical protein